MTGSVVIVDYRDKTVQVDGATANIEYSIDAIHATIHPSIAGRVPKRRGTEPTPREEGKFAADSSLMMVKKSERENRSCKSFICTFAAR